MPLAIGGSLLLLLITAVLIVACLVRKRRLKDDSTARPDVALSTNITPRRSDDRVVSDNAVYAEVSKPNGPSTGNTCGNISNYSQAPQKTQTQTREGKNVIGSDGTVYAEMSGVKLPERKAEVPVPKPPSYSQVEIYASIDHNGKVPPLARRPK
jgi:hypothetical protein